MEYFSVPPVDSDIPLTGMPGDEGGASGAEWSAESDLDGFFSSLYTYYYEHGFWCIVLSRLTRLMCVRDGPRSHDAPC